MIIKTNQLAKLSVIKVEEFVKKTIAFLHENFVEWAESKDDPELKKYVNSMIDFGKKYKINKKTNIQKLIQYHIHYNFTIPLHKKLEGCLTEYKYNEDHRVEIFFIYVKSEKYKLTQITLDANIWKNT